MASARWPPANKARNSSRPARRTPQRGFLDNRPSLPYNSSSGVIYEISLLCICACLSRATVTSASNFTMDNTHSNYLNVAQLLKEPIGATRDYDVATPTAHLADELEQSGPAAGRVRLLRTNRGVLVEGDLNGEIVVECSRCLTEFSLPMTIHLEEEFQPTVDVLRGTYVEVDEEDAALLINEQHILDLSEVIRQALLLEIPLQPLCKPDCAGLCPICGQDLNLGPCDCETGDGDVRWAQLGALLADIEM